MEFDFSTVDHSTIVTIEMLETMIEYVEIYIDNLAEQHPDYFVPFHLKLEQPSRPLDPLLAETYIDTSAKYPRKIFRRYRTHQDLINQMQAFEVRKMSPEERMDLIREK